MDTLYIIIPAYNESENIEKVLKEIKKEKYCLINSEYRI